MEAFNSILFMQKFLRHPRQVGSIAPSSRFLGSKMVNAVSWQGVEAVAELGSGTGAITAMLKTKVGERTKVLLFEKDALMRKRLERKYPRFFCHPNADDLAEAVRRHGISHLDCVLSGLPFFNFSQSVRDRLLEQIRFSLKPGGLFIAFQYSLQMKGQLARSFEIEAVKFVPLNLPPAFVYVCRNK